MCALRVTGTHRYDIQVLATHASKWVPLVRIIAAGKNIDAPTLTRVWQKLEYRIDVCRVTHGAHIEHLYLSKEKLVQFSCGCEQFH
jgi:hypothetical protein